MVIGQILDVVGRQLPELLGIGIAAADGEVEQRREADAKVGAADDVFRSRAAALRAGVWRAFLPRREALAISCLAVLAARRRTAHGQQ